MTLFFRGRTLIVGLIALGAVAGCSPVHGDEAGAESAPTSGMQSDVGAMSGGYAVGKDGKLIQPEVSLSEPTLDKAAFQFNEVGATYAAQHFLSLTEYAWATGNTQPLKDFTTENCVMCLNMIQEIENLYNSGGWTNGIKYKTKKIIRSEQVTEFEDLPKTYGVTLEVNTSANDVYREGKLAKSDGELAEMTVFVQWDEKNWTVVDGSAETIDEKSYF